MSITPGREGDGWLAGLLSALATGRRTMTPRTRLSLAVTVLAATLLSGVGTYSLWSATDVGRDGPALLRSGNLELTLAGEPVVRVVTSDRDALQEFGLADFLAVPGDTVTINQQFSTTLHGENMLGELTVEWDDPAVLPQGVSATYALLDDTGALVPGTAATPLGTAARVAELPADEDTWTLAIDVVLAAAKRDQYTDPAGAGQPAERSDLGDIVIRLEQVRTGRGFGS